MMKNKFVLIRYVLMLWLLCGVSYTQSIASAYDRNTSSQGWGYQPLQTSSSTTGYTASYGGTTTRGGTYSASSLHSSLSERPTFHFQSTSILISPSDMEPMQMMGGNALLSSIWDDEPTGPGTGEVEDPMPIGDTPWLFMLILIATFYSIKGASRLRELQKMPNRLKKARFFAFFCSN